MLIKGITKTVWILSFVSLFTDTASEMLYPVMPLYLKSIGFSILLIGVLEGFAEAVAGLSKAYFGKISDKYQTRMPFVQLGYSLSALSKPLMAFFITPLFIFFIRTIDRMGKGLRTGARDAILSDESTRETKGKVFGFHRSMDTFGAVLGPLSALVYLYYHPGNYKTLFLIAFIPGVLAVLFSALLKDKKTTKILSDKKVSFFSFFDYWRVSPTLYRKLGIGLLFFTLFNSSDVFLLLKIKQAGHNDSTVISIYIFYNLVYALVAYPIGIIADKIGFKKTLIFGLILFALVYFGMNYATMRMEFLTLFFIYGIYAASTEGIAKAWISNISDAKDTAKAIGTFAGLQSICSLFASSLAGFLWFRFGSEVVFTISGVASLIAVVYLFFIPPGRTLSY